MNRKICILLFVLHILVAVSLEAQENLQISTNGPHTEIAFDRTGLV